MDKEDSIQINGHLAALAYLIEVFVGQIWGTWLSKAEAETVRATILDRIRTRMTLPKGATLDSDGAFRVQELAAAVAESVLTNALARADGIRPQVRGRGPQRS